MVAGRHSRSSLVDPPSRSVAHAKPVSSYMQTHSSLVRCSSVCLSVLCVCVCLHAYVCVSTAVSVYSLASVHCVSSRFNIANCVQSVSYRERTQEVCVGKCASAAYHDWAVDQSC